MAGWSPLRTAPARPTLWPITKAALFAWLAPAVLGVLLIGVGLLFDAVMPEAEPRPVAYRSHNLAIILGLFGLYSPALSWVGLPIGLPLSYVAIIRGRAGWLIYALIGILSGCLAMILLEAPSGLTLRHLLSLRYVSSLILPASFGLMQALAYGWLLRRLMTKT